MIVFFVLLLVLFFVIMIFASDSKSSSFKGQFKDGSSVMSTSIGKSITGLGESLKASSIEAQIKEIDLKFGFTPRYQENNKILFINSSIVHKDYKKSELNDRIARELVEMGRQNDANLKVEIENNNEFYRKCKELNISKVSLFGCRIGIYDLRQPLKEGDYIQAYKVGGFSLEKI